MKTIKILLLLAVLLLITACGNKLQFKAQEPLENAALVYIYVPINVSADESTSSTDYSLRINNKPVMERIEEGEYMALNLKPQAMTISATKSAIQEQVLKMDLKAGQIYYLKIRDDLSDGAFEFLQVENSVGTKEIATTGLAGSNVESPDNIITEFVNPKETESMVVKQNSVSPVQQNISQVESTPYVSTSASKATSSSIPVVKPMYNASKTDEIMKAFDMKEKGILTDEEFKSLKTNILNK